MLYHLLYPLHTDFAIFNVFRYITFRTIYACLTAFLLCFLLGPWVIRKLRTLQIGQYIRDEGPKHHNIKAGTPTMGGSLIVFSVVLSTLLWANLTNPYIWIILFVVISYGLIGFADDWLMQIKKRNMGLSARQKLFLQTVTALIAGTFFYFCPDFDTRLTLPFFKKVSPDLGWIYIFFAAFVIVGTSNAVNLTDGLDGLAIGPVIVVAVTYMIFAYVTGHVKIAGYLQINYVAGSGEASVFCGVLAGAGLGFLWFNAYPAQVFMGDVGSLPLGGLLGFVAIVIRQELMLLIVGGIFVIEALSVMMQVGYFKATGGKRIFLVAPIHHHFHLKGWPESKVVTRFWLVAALFAALALATTKLR